MAPEHQRHVFDTLMAAGEPHGIRLFGVRALLTMRLEKMFGTWFREYRPIFTPYESRMDRYVKLDHEFVGRDALEARRPPPRRYLSYFEVDPDPDDPADVIGDEPIWHRTRRLAVVGWVTSGGYAHYTGKSLALGYVEAAVAGDPGDRQRSRSRSSAAGARRRCCTNRCSTHRVSGCGADRGAPRRPRPPHSPCSTRSSPTSASTVWPTSRCVRWRRALGVSVNSLMHHFGSKDDLIITALRRSGRVQQDVERPLAQTETGLVAGRPAPRVVAVDQRVAEQPGDGRASVSRRLHSRPHWEVSPDRSVVSRSVSGGATSRAGSWPRACRPTPR